MILGWIGVGLLMIAFFLLVSKWSKYYLKINIIASTLLTTHAIIIRDLPFIIVNGFIVIMLIIKSFKGGIK